MIFTLVWKKSAEDSLAGLWVEHEADRSALSNAANQIDFFLRENPQGKGKPYIGQARTLLVPPLGVIFRVFESDRLVRILAAGIFLCIQRMASANEEIARGDSLVVLPVQS